MGYSVLRTFVLVLCLFPLHALATESRSIHVEWGYTPPNEPQVTGFKLYQEGEFVCEVQDPSANAMDCEVILASDPTNFTLTATFADDTESPHSAPFAFSSSDTDVLADADDTASSASIPTVSLTSDTAAGYCPLTVAFDGSASSTSDDGVDLVSFLWDFGDGTSGDTAAFSHVYTEPGTYIVTLTVTDSLGQQNSVSTPIVVSEALSSEVDESTLSKSQATGTSLASDSESTTTEDTASASSPVDLHLEVGDILVASDWVRVTFDEPYTHPIVAAGPPRSADQEPCTVQIRNVTTAGFDIRLAEWPSQDGTHEQEKVSYLVLEQGTSALEDGTVIVAGHFTGTTTWKQVNFPSGFAQTPVVFTSVTTVNEDAAVTGRVIPGTAGFSYLLQGEESAGNSHAAETVHYVAWAAGAGSLSGLQYEAVADGVYLASSWANTGLQGRFLQAPAIFAQIQSSVSLDTAVLRLQKVSQTRFKAKIEEEQSLDAEVEHPEEQICYLAIAPTGPARLATFSWEFDQAKESSISGFRVLADGEEVCETDAPSARALSCTIIAPTQKTSYSVVSFTGDDEESLSSNTIVFDPALAFPRLATFSWEFDQAQESGISGFKIFADGKEVCTTDDPAARQLECTIVAPLQSTGYSVAAIMSEEEVSGPSNTITYTP